jgi:hypothetical protein
VMNSSSCAMVRLRWFCLVARTQRLKCGCVRVLCPDKLAGCCLPLFHPLWRLGVDAVPVVRDSDWYNTTLAGLASLGPLSSRGRSGSLKLPSNAFSAAFAGATCPCVSRARTSRRVPLATPRCVVLPGP